MPESFQLRLFGGIELLHNGRAVTSIRTQKTKALLAYLALNANRPLARKTLAGLLWGESTPERAAHNLRQALSLLRRTIDLDQINHPLQTSRQAVAFVPNDQFSVDVIHFEKSADSKSHTALETAVKLYTGRLLDGVFIDNAPEFELWLLQEQERLFNIALNSLEHLSDFYMAQGAYERVKKHLTQAVELAPWQESVHRGLMRSMALTGDIVGALAQYDKCCQILRGTLAVEPLGATVDLYEQIRAGDVGNESAANHTNDSEGLLPTLRFVGRGVEHAQLTTALARVNVSHAETVFIEGEVGMGKTRLIEEFSRFALSQRAIILRGRCFDFSGTVAYQPIIEAMRAGLAIQESLPQLSPVWLAECARLLPELIDFFPELPSPDPDLGASGQQRLFTAVGRFFHHLTEPEDQRPIILFLDDLHWADGPTVDLLHFLIRQSQNKPFLFLGSYRPEETPPTHPLTILRRGLSRDRLINLIQLKPLNIEAIQTAIKSISQTKTDTGFSQYLLKESEGNPFVLTEVFNSLFDSAILTKPPFAQWQLTPDWKQKTSIMTASLRDTILNRVDRLPSESQSLLKTAAIIGRTFEISLLSQLENDPVTTASNLKLWREHRLVKLISVSEKQFDFAHDKIREVIVTQLPQNERKKIHRQVGQAMERWSAKLARSVTQAPAIAHQYFHSDQPDLSLPFLLQAARQARQALAFSAVVGHCNQALTLTLNDVAQHYEFLRLRQESSEFLGHHAQEEADALTMLTLAENEQDSQMAMAAQKRLSIFYMHRNPAKAQEIIDRTLPVYKANEDRENEAETLLVSAILKRNMGQTDRAFDLFSQSCELAHEIGNAQSEGFSLGYIALEQVRRGELSDALVKYSRAVALLKSVGKQSVELGYTLIGMTNLCRILGQYALAKETITETGKLGEALGHMGIQCWVQLHLGKIALWQDEVEQAQGYYSAALSIAEPHRFDILKGHALWGLGVIGLNQKLFKQAQKYFTGACAEFQEKHTDMLFVSQAYLGWIQANLGNFSAAQKQLSQTEQAFNKLIIEGQQIHFCNTQTLHMMGQVGKANRWLMRGKKMIQKQSSKLDTDGRNRFLVAGPINRWFTETEG